MKKSIIMLLSIVVFVTTGIFANAAPGDGRPSFDQGGSAERGNAENGRGRPNQNKGKGHRRQKRGGPGGAFLAPVYQLSRMALMLELTEEQSDEILDAVTGAQPAAYDLALQIAEKRKELRDLGKAQRESGEAIDEDLVSEMREQIKPLREDLKEVQKQLRKDINGILTDEQRAKLETFVNTRKGKGKGRKGRGRGNRPQS